MNGITKRQIKQLAKLEAAELGEVWLPDADRLAAQLGYAKPSIYRAISEMCEAGELTQLRKGIYKINYRQINPQHNTQLQEAQ